MLNMRNIDNWHMARSPGACGAERELNGSGRQRAAQAPARARLRVLLLSSASNRVRWQARQDARFGGLFVVDRR